MRNEEKILQMLSEMQTDMKAMKGRLDRLQRDVTKLKEDVAELKEAHEITRNGVNALLEWSNKIGEVQHLPLPKIRYIAAPETVPLFIMPSVSRRMAVKRI